MVATKSVAGRVAGGVAGLVLAGAMAVAPAHAAGDHLRVTVDGLKPGGIVSRKLAFCVPNGKGEARLGPNRNPAISWSSGPSGTRSYAIVVHDSDVPSVGTNVNKKGVTLGASLPRVNFYHWVLVDIPPTVRRIPYAAVSDGVTDHGKPPGPAKYGVRGVNSYTQWFAGNPKMKGTYGGYDGPCPPWNDSIPHHYHFAVYALDVARLPLNGDFSGPQALKAMHGHVLGKGSVTGLYSVNPAVIRRLEKRH